MLIQRLAIAIAAVALIVVSVGATKGWGGTAKQQLALSQIEEISQPGELVEFAADLSRKSHDYEFRGRYYRRQDGSFREEGITQGVGKSPESVIGIVDLTKQIAYIFKDSRGWASSAIDASPQKPLRRRVAIAGVAGLTLETEPYEGLTVYRGNRSTGDYELLAPSLNFFAVVVQSGKTGMRTEYKNITVGAQDQSLFELPVGAVVQTNLPVLRPRTGRQ